MLNYPASPNVLIIACNGLSYGDISCHGNPRIQTPNLDKLFHHGIRLDQFHIELHPKLVHKHLIFSHNDQDSSISKDINLPLIFGYNDYITGFFGEWHLADQLSQGNKYFNEFFTTNHPVELSQELKRAKFSYSHTTNHSFFLAEEFIKKCSNNKKQFMILISTNNFEHNQFLELSESATLPFFDKELSGHFHSINNIDTLIGSLNKVLELEKNFENTLVIFMATEPNKIGTLYYNAGLRGEKGSLYEGAHRVPCFLRWPIANWNTGETINFLSHPSDLLPTLIQACQLKLPAAKPLLHGYDLNPLINKEEHRSTIRTILLKTPKIQKINKYQTAILRSNWRLVNGKELYDITSDPSQNTNLSSMYPNLVKTFNQDSLPSTTSRG